MKSEEHLREIWSGPTTRVALLNRLGDVGFSRDDLREIQKLIDAENSDLFDVLEYVAYAKPTVTREERVEASRKHIYAQLDDHQREFVDFVLAQYVYLGVDELAQERLPQLISIKYHSQMEGIATLGGTEKRERRLLDFRGISMEKLRSRGSSAALRSAAIELHAELRLNGLRLRK